jgi:anaerobic selenocysteine-containing dehydrogenase
MSNSLKREFPNKAARITTGCQYCAVGCGYNAFLTPVDDGLFKYKGVSRFITDAMTNQVKFKGTVQKIAVTPDARCDLNKGNHSVRGGSQGHNLVTADGQGRSTTDRLKSPMVRLANNEWADITWDALNDIMARLVIDATGIEVSGSDEKPKLKISNPDRLGVKLYEYQYLENTYAATKLFYGAIGTRNVAYHDRPSTAGSSPGMRDAGLRPHDFSYDDVLNADVVFVIGANPYENQSVFFMQYCQGKEMIVMDPRRTATAHYAVQTGGMHLQPKYLGADSFVLYAMARSLIEDYGFDEAALDLKIGNPDALEAGVGEWEKRRRKSRVMDFHSFREFLVAGAYTLSEAAKLSGIPQKDLEAAVKRLARKKDGSRPNIAILYEKGMIWGFNYHNTAAIASLGVLLGSYGRPGRLSGRVGGHQKGWAENAKALEMFECSVGGYPFRVQENNQLDGDRYSDALLQKEFGEATEILVKHNLDNHVFGPTEKCSEDQSGLADDEVRLRNNLVTRKQPDVRLLWIIGGNYLGQTNMASVKRARLLDRLKAGGARIDRPANADVDTVVDTLTQRMKRNSIVLVHQEIFANPTTEFCDIVIPAAGWGEDSFSRYNAQRRLKLYDRFQDMPLHPKDAEAIGGDDPMVHVNTFLHSPKPDWRIFRDIARRIGRLRDKKGEAGVLFNTVKTAFDWKDAAVLADEMAHDSHRGLKGCPKKNKGNSLLGDLYLFGKDKLPAGKSVVHAVLGAEGDGEAKLLRGNENYLVVNETIDDHKNRKREDENVSAVYGNGVASNGVMLPVRYEDGVLKGTLRLVQTPAEFFFVKAPWNEIEWAYERANGIEKGEPSKSEVLLTNGRVNHLWNNMFHHLRNDYVNERYPEDMPGTLLELNPDWARHEGISNGQVVEVTGPSGKFRAVASLQDGVAGGGAFAMFSYPVRCTGAFTFDGYPNNFTDGYADGINPIAALKYARATVRKLPDPATGDPDWIYRSATRQGPTYEQRNRVGPTQPLTAHGDPMTVPERRKWEMRELIVRKGLPRAAAHGSQDRQSSFSRPNELLESLREGLKWNFANFLRGEIMKYPKSGTDAGRYDYWHGKDLEIAEEWLTSQGVPHPANIEEGDNADDSQGGSSNEDREERTEMASFERVKEILDAAIGGWKQRAGRDPNLTMHGNPFGWATKAELLASAAFGRKLIEENQIGNGNGAETELIAALKTGSAPFSRMPSGGPFVSDAEIQEIVDWIDAGCPGA